MAMSLTVCRDGIYDAFLGDDLDRAFLHGHSFTANPLGCAAGLASLELLLDPRLSTSSANDRKGPPNKTGGLATMPKAEKARVRGPSAPSISAPPITAMDRRWVRS